MDAGTIAIVATVAGAATSAVGAIQQGNAANAAAKFNAGVAENNAALARSSASANAQREERMGRKRVGAIRANIGASGVQLAGTPLDVLADTASENKLNELTIIHQGEVEAIGFSQTAMIQRLAGAQAKKAGLFKAGSTLLLGGASAASMKSSLNLNASSSPGTSAGLDSSITEEAFA